MKATKLVLLVPQGHRPGRAAKLMGILVEEQELVSPQHPQAVDLRRLLPIKIPGQAQTCDKRVAEGLVVCSGAHTCSAVFKGVAEATRMGAEENREHPQRMNSADKFAPHPTFASDRIATSVTPSLSPDELGVLVQREERAMKHRRARQGASSFRGTIGQ